MIPVQTILLKMNNAYQNTFVVTVNLVGSALQYKTILRYTVNRIHVHLYVHIHVGDVVVTLKSVHVILRCCCFSTITLAFLVQFTVMVCQITLIILSLNVVHSMCLTAVKLAVLKTLKLLKLFTKSNMNRL